MACEPAKLYTNNAARKAHGQESGQRGRDSKFSASEVCHHSLHCVSSAHDQAESRYQEDDAMGDTAASARLLRTDLLPNPRAEHDWHEDSLDRHVDSCEKAEDKREVLEGQSDTDRYCHEPCPHQVVRTRARHQLLLYALQGLDRNEDAHHAKW
eukprot:CAMPEP_0115600446 /NCGR_PEP_ID=MMETSP0272-20121206/14896_1 /TAXON_ID=71861 /ORGANISM="Scrippsiella trochoidea, Strain CCMP3099" /LENGTH=153 /DNA_ID=CAMNT_0003035897 /DNA_START=255 /DNA_END=713 /DNA_ORIENTATION=+